MKSNRKQRLIELGAEALADALLNLSLQLDVADDVIENLIAAPKENLLRIKKKLTSLKRSKRFIDWRGSAGLARELEMLLDDLKSGVTDPETGLELVAAFYETDESVLGHCDDSSGYIGHVFCFNAKDLFVEYASRCSDKEKVADTILRIHQKDDYGVRDVLIDCAGECLPESVVRGMISALQKRAHDAGDDKYRRRSNLWAIESLARQLKDAKLFEETRIESWDKLSTAAYIDIARVYLESGEVETAYSWVKKIPPGETFQAHERDKLLLEIYKRKGDTEKVAEVLYEQFQIHHSIDTLEALLAVIGEDKREEVISDEISQIQKNKDLCTFDADFFVSIGKVDEAEDYIINRAEQLNGDFYGSLLSLAEVMEQEGRNLAASLLYRSLLDSILKSGRTKAYSHGVRYLKKLDLLSTNTTDWKNQADHDAFKEQVCQDHGRKRSFWEKYESK